MLHDSRIREVPVGGVSREQIRVFTATTQRNGTNGTTGTNETIGTIGTTETTGTNETTGTIIVLVVVFVSRGGKNGRDGLCPVRLSDVGCRLSYGAWGHAPSRA